MESMNWFIYLRDILEVIYYLSGIGLLAVGLWGLTQIKIAKEQIVTAKEAIKINSLREAGLLAAKQCESFSQNFLPRINRITHERIIKKYPEFMLKEKLEKDDFNNIDLLLKKSNYEDFEKFWFIKKETILLINNQVNPLMNDLEAFSLYFTKQIADEGIAYVSVGNAYCKFLEEIGIPYIIYIRNNTNKNVYSNIVELYLVWKSRSEAENLENQMERLKIQYDSLENKRIHPTGTE